jgi:alginate O-acetyltransferase complex protein AlgJ
VVVPTPVKPSLHPEQLTTRAVARAAPLQNSSYDELVGELRRDGILVFDPADVMGRGDGPDTSLYLKTDTHWRPETMRRTAEALAVFLRQQVTLPERPASPYRVEPREARQVGDTLAMLDLPPDQRLFPIERVALDFVVGPDGDPWRPSRDADVIVLGDSFSNIYSLPTMGWGEAAGLVEHLSLALGRPVDRLVQNDDGASATRRLLAREVTGTAGDRLDGKRVVVWQLAARELAFGDWEVIALAAPAR